MISYTSITLLFMYFIGLLLFDFFLFLFDGLFFWEIIRNDLAFAFLLLLLIVAYQFISDGHDLSLRSLCSILILWFAFHDLLIDQMTQKELLLDSIDKVVSVFSVNNEDTIVDIGNSTCVALLV